MEKYDFEYFIIDKNNIQLDKEGFLPSNHILNARYPKKQIKEMKLVGNTTLRVNEMVFDSHYLICLLNTAISIYTFSSSSSSCLFYLIHSIS